MNVTHLCVFSVGGFNGYKNYGIPRAKNETFARAKEVAEELDLRFVTVDSNFDTTFIERYAFFHTYQDMMAVYALQKLWRIYYYSSTGWDYSYFSVVNTMNDSCAKYDLLSLQCFSTKYLRIYSDGGERDRLEKTKVIAREPIVQKNLRVCTRDREPRNCGKCIKCRRTLLMLDACGVLDAYRDAFDLDYYREHITEYYKWFYHTHTGNSNEKMFTEQIYMKLRDNPDYVAVAKRERLKDIIKAPIRLFYRFLKKLQLYFRGNSKQKI